MTITQQQVITILKTGVYPVSQKTLQYFQQKQKFVIYPSVEVNKVQSDSNTTQIDKTNVEQTFEIRFYMKYTRPEAVEEADRLSTENEMLRVLETNDIIPTGLIYFESKTWSTNVIDDSIYGSRSVLRFTIKDISLTDATGIIGSGDKIELNSQTTPIQIQILGMSGRKGFTIDTHYSDDRQSVYDPSLRTTFGEFTITYKQTNAIKTIIEGLNDVGLVNNGKLIKGGVTTNFSFLVGQTNTNGTYGEVEKATTVFYATATW